MYKKDKEVEGLTNIWNPASKILNFENIEKRMTKRGILHTFGFEDICREIFFPVDKNFLFGNIVLLEYYKQDEGFYFLYWDKIRASNPSFFKSSYLYKIDSKTGRTVSEGSGLELFERYLSSDSTLAKLGIPREDYSFVKENLPIFFKRLLNVIDYEIKNTIRSNAEDFILNLIS